MRGTKTEVRRGVWRLRVVAGYDPGGQSSAAVTHADCEALADRIRADLAAQGVIAGPALEGPAWTAVGF